MPTKQQSAGLQAGLQVSLPASRNEGCVPPAPLGQPMQAAGLLLSQPCQQPHAASADPFDKLDCHGSPAHGRLQEECAPVGC